MINDNDVLNALKQSGAIVHSDGNIFMTNVSVAKRFVSILVSNEVANKVKPQPPCTNEFVADGCEQFKD